MSIGNGPDVRMARRQTAVEDRDAHAASGARGKQGMVERES